MAPASSNEFLDIQANYRVWIHYETRTWHDKNIQHVFFVVILFEKKTYLVKIFNLQL